VEIGSAPSTYLAQKLGVVLDEKGYIKVDQNCQTNLTGVFAAGDVTDQTRLKQILTAASQGAMATYGAYQYLTKKK
jgi:thioredoxin reductase